MFAALKKLFSRGASTSESAPVPPPQPSAPPQRSLPARPSMSPVAPHMRAPAPPPTPPVNCETSQKTSSPSAGYGGYKFAPVPPASQGAESVSIADAPTTTVPKFTPAMPSSGAGESVSLPLSELLKGLPEALRLGVIRQPASDALISLPLATILPQVASGAVTIPFGQLRFACPEGVFLDSSVHDQTIVTLPLGLILPRINPQYLARRPGQRRTVDPSSFEAVFAKAGQADVCQSATPPSQLSAQEPPVQRASAQVSASQTHVANPFTPIAPSSPTPIPMAAPLPFAKVAPLPSSPLPPLRTPPLPSTPATRSSGAQLRSAAPAVSVEQPVTMESLWIPMNLLAPHWPENVQMILIQPVYAAGKIGIPISELEAGLKHGKLVFSWKQLRAWIQPTPPADEIADDLLVPLPLQTIVPLFLSKRNTGTSGPQKRIKLDENIPDVFSSSSTGAGLAVATPVSATSTPPVPMPSVNLPQAAAEEPHDKVAIGTLEVAEDQDIGLFFRQPGKKTWTPVEIVAKTANLPGIVGCLISLQDGLLVAGQAPAGINTETVAAFLPQVFGRMAHYTRELKFGEPSYAGLVLEEYSLHIYKTGNVYFLAMGRAGEQAPLAQLAVIAAQLERQSKPN